MWTLVISMLVVLVLAGLVVVYVAFPHRGEEVPAAPWLGDALRKGVDSAPTLDNTAQDAAPVDDGTLGFSFSEPEPTGPSHRDG
ncbi:hypothetical protein [Nocardioides cynanchi]|uniref:hypothetical protein n=1 Tax=Nocardioides cynanchi TaxID=2558918 RepID=UPI001248ED5C|nr:hypothetical protein [Nocardioides cynanchi]